MYQDAKLCVWEGGISSLESFSFIKDGGEDSLYLFIALLINTLVEKLLPETGPGNELFSNK